MTKIIIQKPRQTFNINKLWMTLISIKTPGLSLCFYATKPELISTLKKRRYARNDTEILVKGLGELVHGRWNLQSHLENPPLPLNLNHLRHLNESAQIPLWWQSPSNSKLLRPLLEQWIRHLLLNKSPPHKQTPWQNKQNPKWLNSTWKGNL